MEFGEDDVRILTEIDRIEAPRRIWQIKHPDRAILIEEDGHRERWDSTIDHFMYGKLTFSYYPKQATRYLEQYHLPGFGEEKEDGGLCVEMIPVWSCADAGMQYLQKHLQQALHDALCGLVMEAAAHGLSERNGHKFMIPDLNQERQINEIRKHYSRCMNKRLGTRQGHRKNAAEFLFRAYQAYCDAADELNIPPSKTVTRNAKMRVTQEKLVEHLKRKRSQDGEGTISVRGFAKQLKEHGITYSKFVERCEYSRGPKQAEPMTMTFKVHGTAATEEIKINT